MEQPTNHLLRHQTFQQLVARNGNPVADTTTKEIHKALWHYGPCSKGVQRLLNMPGRKIMRLHLKSAVRLALPRGLTRVTPARPPCTLQRQASRVSTVRIAQVTATLQLGHGTTGLQRGTMHATPST